MIPGWLLAQKPDANDLLVYATLASFGRFDTLAGCYEECRPALSTIAEQAGISVSSVKRGIGNLMRLGAIERQQRWADDGKTQLPSVYRVIFGAIVGPQEQGGFTGEPRGESTGEQGRGSQVSQNPEPSTQNQDTQKPSTSSRGTRLPTDWAPDDDLLAWCLAELVPGGRWSEPSRDFVRREHAKFTDYWISKPGKAGVKLDWAATWRNWMRRAFERFDATRPVSSPPQTFRERDEANAQAKRQRRAVVLELAQQLIDAGVSPREAVARAEREIDERANAANAVETNKGVPYIVDGDVVRSTTYKEVTGS
jgi:hypothetical protein